MCKKGYPNWLPGEGPLCAGSKTSVAEAKHAVAACRELQIVGDENAGQTMCFVQVLDQVEDDICCLSIKIAGGLISQKQLRLGDEGAGEADALLFALRLTRRNGVRRDPPGPPPIARPSPAAGGPAGVTRGPAAAWLHFRRQ